MWEFKNIKMKEELSEKIKSHPKVKVIKDITTFSSVLTGGAVLDLIEGKEPKDFDLLYGDRAKFITAGFTFAGETKTATTLIKDDIIVQLLKTNPENFDYTISQSKYDFRTEKLTEFDELSFESKVLIPTRVAFENKENALNSLQRLPHWQRKGFRLPDTTYQSLLGVISRENKIYSYSYSS